MADKEKDKQIDEMLDSLLAKYSSAEPRPGLETRILANLREAEEKKAPQGWWSFKWVWAGAVAAAIVIAVVLIGERNRTTPPANIIVKTNQPAPQPQTQPHAPAVRNEAAIAHRRKPSTPTLPQHATLALSERPANFPTPVPLSEQERMMFTYLANTPKEVVIAQIPRNNDQQESEEFWAERELSTARHATTNR